MTRHETESYLRKANEFRTLLDMYDEQIEELEHRLSGIKAITYDGIKVQTSREDNNAVLYDKIIAITKRRDEVCCQYIDYKQTINEELVALRNPLHRDILYYYYIVDDNMTLEQIADKLHYSHSHVRREHGNALVNFGRNRKSKHDTE